MLAVLEDATKRIEQQRAPVRSTQRVRLGARRKSVP
jgi:hypothetical protein